MLRPLLGFQRQELEHMCQYTGVAWETDPSNADPQFERVRVRAALALSLPPVLALRVGLDVLRRALGALRWLVRRVLELQGGVRRLRSEGCATGWEGTLSLFRGFVQLQSAWRLQVGGGPVCPAGASPPPADLEQGGSAGSHFFSVDSGLTPLAYEPSFSTRAASGASGSTGGVTIGSHVRATSGSSLTGSISGRFMMGRAPPGRRVTGDCNQW